MCWPVVCGCLVGWWVGQLFVAVWLVGGLVSCLWLVGWLVGWSVVCGMHLPSLARRARNASTQLT